MLMDDKCEICRYNAQRVEFELEEREKKISAMINNYRWMEAEHRKLAGTVDQYKFKAEKYKQKFEKLHTAHLKTKLQLIELKEQLNGNYDSKHKRSSLKRD